MMRRRACRRDAIAVYGAEDDSTFCAGTAHDVSVTLAVRIWLNPQAGYAHDRGLNTAIVE